MSGEAPAANALQCVERGAVADVEARRWRGDRADDPEDDQARPELAFYCPACAEREFAEE